MEQQKYRIGLTKEQAPPYVTYPFVLRGYRTGGSYKRCLQSLFEWHAETLNAWTMIVGAFISTCLLLWTWSSLELNFTTGLPFIALTTSVWVHMPFSVAFHLCRGMNPQVYNLWRRLDQVFIFQVSILLTFGISYHVFTWKGIAANTFAAFVVGQLATIDVWNLSPTYQRNRNHMVIFVGSTVMCYWFPMLYQAVSDFLQGHFTEAAALAAATFAVLQLGGVIFAAGFPEKYFPGVFDTIGYSHQLMHVCASLAHILEYRFLYLMFKRLYLADEWAGDKPTVAIA